MKFLRSLDKLSYPVAIYAALGYIAFVFWKHATTPPPKYETICLIEPQGIVTYRGISTKPEKVDKTKPGTGPLIVWEFKEYSGEKPGPVVPMASGDCFYHPVE